MADVKISGLPASTVPLAGTEVLPIVQGGQTRQVSVNNLTVGKSVSGLNFVPSGATIPTNGVYLPAANNVGFATNTTERMRIDSSGNVGIGVAAPTDSLHARGTAQRFDKSLGTSVGQIRLHTVTDSYATIWSLGQPISSTDFVTQYWNGSSWAERMRIATTGDVSVTNGNLVMGTAAKGIDFSINPNPAGATSELLNDYEVGTFTPVGFGITYTSAVGRYVKVGNLVMVQINATFPVTASTNQATFFGLPFTNNTTVPAALAVGYTGLACNLNINGNQSYAYFYSPSGAVITNANFSGLTINCSGVYSVD